MRRSETNKHSLSLSGLSPCHFILVVVSIFLFYSPATLALEWSLEKSGEPTVGTRADEWRLRGIWPNSCTPELKSISAGYKEGSKISTFIELTSFSKQENCTPKSTAFSILTELPTNTSIDPEFYWYHYDPTDRTPRLLGFKLLALSHIQAGMRPASGWWWPEPGVNQDSGPGTGLTVDFQNGLLTLITQAFDNNGQPEWLLGTAPLAAGISSTQLIRFINGQTLSGGYTPPLIDHTRNSIHIRFLSASRASVWLETRQGESLNQKISLRHLSMVKYYMDPPVLDRLLIGRWLLVAEDSPDYSNQTQQFRIHSIQLDGNSVSLHETDGSQIGSCILRLANTDSPPVSCDIHTQAGTNTESWTFNSFSLERMRGKNQDSGRVTAFKVSRY